MLIATLFAGQHTSSITSSWTGLTMIRDQVRDHIMTQHYQIRKHPYHVSCIKFQTEAAPFCCLLGRAHHRGSREDTHC